MDLLPVLVPVIGIVSGALLIGGTCVRRRFAAVYERLNTLEHKVAGLLLPAPAAQTAPPLPTAPYPYTYPPYPVMTMG